MRALFLRLGVSVMILVGTKEANAQSAPPAVDDGSAPPAATGGDVIVTASRRGQSVRSTPTAVSAYTGATLQNAQIASLSDLASVTPNVQFGQFSTNTNVSIRGIGNTQVTAGSDPGVAVHVDGVYLSQTGLATSTFLDVERVEILRGPQGTLFGRNATGGAVNIIPNRPTELLSAGFDVSAGVDPGEVRSSGFVSGPLAADGRLQGRIAAQQTYRQGYTRNLLPGGPNRLDGVTNYSGRAQLQFAVTDALRLRASVEYQKEDDNGAAFFNLGSPTGTLAPQIATASRGSLNNREVYANVGLRKLDAVTGLLTADLALGDGNLRALYSYNDTRQHNNGEDDGTAVAFASGRYDQKSHQYFTELLYTSDAKQPVSVVLGANYFRENLSQAISVPISILPIPVDLGGTIRTTSFAGFGQLQYRFMPGGRVFAGLRYSNDRKSINEYNVFIGTSAASKRWGRLTYEAGISYDFARSVTGYAKYATGYKSGGFSAGSLAPAFNPETNASVEVGLKGRYLGGALEANLAAFHMKYSDLQVNQVKGVSASITNAAKATIDGAEAELTVRPAKPFRLELSGGYLNARFDSFLTQDSARPALGTLDLSGNRLPQAPRFTASSGAYYDVAAGGGKVTLGARYDWKSRNYLTEFNLPVASQAPVGKLDLTLRYRSRDDRFTAGLYALNVTDAKIVSNVLVVSAILGSSVLGSLQPGRQVGVSVGYKF